MGDQETDIPGDQKVTAREQLENIPRSNLLLAIGGSLTGVSSVLLSILGQTAEKENQTLVVQTDALIPQLVDHMVNRNLFLDIGLWTILITGIALLICGLKTRFPNPEDIEFEEEWERKGR